jgi:DMSO/TMAO reductase YedYZ molybdopterin-dependent catalytic subunit
MTWTFACFGLVKQPVTWSWSEFVALPRVEVTSDIHCVTRWSRFDNRWEGVSIAEVLRRVEPLPEAKAVMIHADPDYTTNLLLSELNVEDALLALRHDGAELPLDHGGPCRLVVPRLYFWKSAKWVRALEFLDHNAPGFWEMNGYHLRGDPWSEERYAAQETDAMQRMRAESARQRRSR